jgi:hypothetical protein
VFLTSDSSRQHIVFLPLQSVERAFAIVILDERYEGCAMYPNMESVMNERAVFDRRMSRDELIGKKMAAREVYNNEEYSLRLSEHRRCISSARSDRAGKIGARHFFDEYYGCNLKNADPTKVEKVREKKLSLKGKVRPRGTCFLRKCLRRRCRRGNESRSTQRAVKSANGTRLTLSVVVCRREVAH